MRDFVPVAAMNYSDLVMVVHPSVPAKDLKEFIALAKSKPGELNYASSGPGTPYHMAGELFKAMSGTDIVHVPHKASGEMRNSVIGGHVQMAFDAITTMAPNVQGGPGARARHLAPPSARRCCRTFRPSPRRACPATRSTIWLGIMAPAGTPKAIVDKLNAEINKAISRPDVKAAWDKQGAVPLAMTPAEFDAYLRKDIEKWAQGGEGRRHEGAVTRLHVHAILPSTLVDGISSTRFLDSTIAKVRSVRRGPSGRRRRARPIGLCQAAAQLMKTKDIYKQAGHLIRRDAPDVDRRFHE